MFGKGGALLATWRAEKIHSDKPCGKGENQYDRHTGSGVWTWDSNPSTLLRSGSCRANGLDSELRRERERERGGGGEGEAGQRFHSAALHRPYVNLIKRVRGKSTDVCKSHPACSGEL